MKPPVKIPHHQLNPDTLRNLIEEFATRNGTDYGESEVSLDRKIEQIYHQLKTGKAVIVFDPEEGPANLARKIAQWMEADPQYRFRRKVRTKFTWKAIFEQEILPMLADRS